MVAKKMLYMRKIFMIWLSKRDDGSNRETVSVVKKM